MLPLQKYDHERPKGPIYLIPQGGTAAGVKERNVEPQALKGRATRVEFVRFDYLLRSLQRLVAPPWRAPSGLASLSTAWTLGVAQGWDRSPLRVYRFVAQLQMSASRVARKIRGRIYEPSDLG